MQVSTRGPPPWNSGGNAMPTWVFKKQTTPHAFVPPAPQEDASSSESFLRSELEQLGPLLEDSCRGTPERTEPEMGLAARWFIFVVFTQVMQALMSYDGGATQMSTQPLLQDGWSSSELGLLGAMDKFGQVATAFVWSHLLMRHDNKLLLVIGLFSKAACCLGFGLLRRKWMMLAAKLGMGVSEALIGVWATVWVQTHAPKDSQARWLGFASISAGAGNGVGSAVAGLCSKHYGYAFAFVLQAGLLFFLWGAMLATPDRCFAFHSGHAGRSGPSSGEGRAGPGGRALSRSVSFDPELLMQRHLAEAMESRALAKRAEPEAELSLFQSLVTVLQSRLWLYTALAISLSCFITSSIAYLWQNTTESVWHLSSQEATCSFLLTTGLGGLVGVAFGPKAFDQYLGGFATPRGVVKCLRWCTYATAASVVLATACAALFLKTAWHTVHYELMVEARDWVLALSLASIFCVFALVNSMQGTLYGINTDSSTAETKTAAAGLTVSMQNVIGFAFGPLLPSITADAAGHAIGAAWPMEGPAVVHSAQFSIGMAASLLSAWPLLVSVHTAMMAARERIENGASADFEGSEEP